MKALIKREQFNGRYLPFEPLAELPDGSIVSGLNMLRASLFGGWTPRYGSRALHETATGASVLSIHQYSNPFHGDYHLFAQIGTGFYSLSQAAEALLTESGEELTTEAGETLLATTAAEPLSYRESLGSSLYTVGTVPGFSCMVGENMIYTDGDTAPIIYGGEQPKCDGFMVYDGTNATYIDYTDEVTDGDSGTYATITAHASTVYYVGMLEKGSEISLAIDTGNTQSVTPTVKAWRAGAWTDVTATDGTDGSETHDQTGSLSWTSGADLMRVIGGRQLYWYQVSFSGAPSAITITACNVVRAMQTITVKWDGEWRNPIGALFYDASATEYVDKLGSVTDGSQSTYMDISSMTTSDYIYIKTQSRVLGFAFIMVEGSINTNNAQVDLVEHIAADGNWTTCGAFTDTTLDSGATDGFAQDGFIWMSNTYDPVETTFAGDDVPGYWHRISVDAALSVSTYIAEIAYATWPDAIPNFKGCTEYLSTLTLWGCPRYPNRLIQSDANRPDFLCRPDLRLSPPFGAYDPILNVVTVGNYVVVYKSNSIYIWDGESDIPTVVSTDVGLASTKTVALISGGDKTMKDDEVRVILMHQARDGVYKLSISSDGYLMTKTSEAIRNYFLPIKDEYIGAEDIDNLQAFYEKATDTYRLLLPTKTLAYSVGTNEWLPPWEYQFNLTCGISCAGPENEQVVIAGTSNGFLLQLETVNYDMNSSQETVAIEHKIKTRPLFVSVENIPSITGLLRKTWVEMLANTYETNLVTNGDMELDSDWVDYGSPTTNERSNEQASSGSYSRKFVAAIFSGIQSSSISLIEGVTYHVTAKIYPVSPATAIYTRINDSDGNSIKTEQTATLVPGVWNTVSFSFTSTVTDSDSVITFRTSGIGPYTYYIDAVFVSSDTETREFDYNLFVNRETTGTAVTKPSSPSLTAAGRAVTVQRFDHREENIHCFQAELSSNAIGQRLEPYSLTYQIKQLRTLV